MRYMEIDPARAKRSKKIDRLWGDPTFIAEEKIDGWRFLMHVGRNLDRVYMTGRRVSQVTGLLSEKGSLVPQIWPSDWSTPGYTVLDGEVTVPGGFRSIAGVMNTDPETAARQIAERGVPTYHVFDVLWLDGEDVREESLHDRRKMLQGLVGGLISGPLSLVDRMPPTKESFDEVIASGGEGVILKDLLEPYGEGWYKVKRSHTLDVIVTGFTDAKIGVTGKYVGQIGSLVLSVYSSSGELIEVGQASGMTDAVRREITDNKDSWMGAVVEVECQEFGRTRLRHPRFKRRRGDANPRSATFVKMMRDLNRGGEVRDQLELL